MQIIQRIVVTIVLALAGLGVAKAAYLSDQMTVTDSRLIDFAGPDSEIQLAINWTAADQMDYDIECNPRRDEKRELIQGDLLLDAVEDFETFRCVREVTGNLVVDADNQTKELVLPYLQKVYGELRLEAGYQLQNGRFPRLHHVGGRIFIDNRLVSGDWQAGALKYHYGRFEVLAGVINPLDGFDALQQLNSLELRRHPNDIYGPQIFSGLNGLQKVRYDLEMNLAGGSAGGAFLQSLTEVGDEVTLTLRDGGLFGLDSVQTIGGDLDVHWNGYGWGNNTQGLGSLQSVGGDFRWHGTAVKYLAGLASLQSVGGVLDLEYASSDLQGLNSLQSVGELRIDNSSLQSLAGLESMVSLGALNLRDNLSLSNVSALHGAKVPGGGGIQITGNWNLSQCKAQSLVRKLRDDPAWNSWNTTTTAVYDNDGCTFTFIAPTRSWWSF